MPPPSVSIRRAEEFLLYYIKVKYRWEEFGDIKMEPLLQAKARELNIGRGTTYNLRRFGRLIGMYE